MRSTPTHLTTITLALTLLIGFAGAKRANAAARLPNGFPTWVMTFQNLYGNSPTALSSGVDTGAAAAHVEQIRDAVAHDQIDAAYKLLVATHDLAPRTGIWTLPPDELPVVVIKLSDVETRGAGGAIVAAIETEVITRTGDVRASAQQSVLHAGIHWVLWPRLEIDLGGESSYLEFVPAAKSPAIAQLKRAAIGIFLSEFARAIEWTTSVYVSREQDAPALPVLRAALESAPAGPGRDTLARLVKSLSNSGPKGCDETLRTAPAAARSKKLH